MRLCLLAAFLAMPLTSLADPADGSFESKVMEALEGNYLPEGFVRIAKKQASGEYEILSGGGLIAPGVVIAPTIAPIEDLRDEEYFYHDYEGGVLYRPSKHKLFPVDGLYILFTTSPGKEVAVKIERIRRFAYGGHQLYAQFMDFAVYFFDPHPEISHIRPIPTVNSDDFSSFNDVVGEVFTAGERVSEAKETFYKWIESADGHREFCQSISDTPSGFGRSQLRFTPDEAEFIWTAIDSYPGKLEKFVRESLKPLFAQDFTGDWYSRAIMHRWKKFYGLSPGSSEYFASKAFMSTVTCQGFCLEGPLYKDLREGDLHTICYKEHRSRAGYPVLWKTPSSKIKMIGIAGGRRDMSEPHEPFSVSGESNFQGVYYLTGINTLLYLPFIRSEILLYNQHVRQQFDAKELDQYIEDTAKPSVSKSFPYVVSVRATYNKGKSVLDGACSGVYIEKGVVLTAAHCLPKKMDNKVFVHGYLLEFKVGEDIYAAQSKTWAIHPDSYFRKSDQVHNSIDDLADLALVFFHEPEDFPDIKPVSLLSAGDSPEKLVAEGYEILKLSYMKPWSTEGQSLRFHQYKALPAEILDDGREFIMKRYQSFRDSPRYHQVILPYVKHMVGHEVEDSLITDKVMKLIEKSGTLSFGEICLNPEIFCLVAKKETTFTQKSHFACVGDSGSPVLAHDGRNTKVVGVHFKGGGSRHQTAGCNPIAASIYLAPYLDWLRKTISWEKDTRPLIQKLWHRLFAG